MRQKTLLKIIGLMRKGLDKGLTILEISKQLKIGYRPAYNHITEMEKEQIIQIEKIGNSKQCKLNLDSPKTRHLLESLKLGELDITETLDILEIGIKEWKNMASPLPSRYSIVNGHYCLVYYNPNKSFSDYFVEDKSEFLNRVLKNDKKSSSKLWIPWFLIIYVLAGLWFYCQKKIKVWFVSGLFAIFAYGLILRSFFYGYTLTSRALLSKIPSPPVFTLTESLSTRIKALTGSLFALYPISSKNVLLSGNAPSKVPR